MIRYNKEARMLVFPKRLRPLGELPTYLKLVSLDESCNAILHLPTWQGVLLGGEDGKGIHVRVLPDSLEVREILIGKVVR